MMYRQKLNNTRLSQDKERGQEELFMSQHQNLCKVCTIVTGQPKTSDIVFKNWELFAPIVNLHFSGAWGGQGVGGEGFSEKSYLENLDFQGVSSLKFSFNRQGRESPVSLQGEARVYTQLIIYEKSTNHKPEMQGTSYFDSTQARNMASDILYPSWTLSWTLGCLDAFRDKCTLFGRVQNGYSICKATETSCLKINLSVSLYKP